MILCAQSRLSCFLSQRNITNCTRKTIPCCNVILLCQITCFSSLYSGDQIVKASLALEEARINLVEQCTKAMELQAEVRVQLSHKERWRIPLVLLKVSKNKDLNDSDDKIWTAVSSNLKTQDDIDNLTEVTLPTALNTPTHLTSRNPRRTLTNEIPCNKSFRSSPITHCQQPKQS